jgi:hypothetical protein
MDIQNLGKTLVLTAFSRRGLGDTGHRSGIVPEYDGPVNSAIGLIRRVTVDYSVSSTAAIR